jgi:hypothetical protein
MAGETRRPIRKRSGRLTEPDLPDRVVVDARGVLIEHYYRGGDHAPPHLHVVYGEGPSTRIGQGGKPLRGDPEPSPVQRSVIEEHRLRIRRTIHKIMAWHRFNEL